MNKVDDIKKAVLKLAPSELASFRTWFEEFEESHFDQKIEEDARAGKLDKLAEEALKDFRKGRAREIMRQFASPAFWETYQRLPAQVRKIADKNYTLLKEDPRHPRFISRRWAIVGPSGLAAVIGL